jgi:hypothetical protein
VYPDPKHWLKILAKTEIFHKNYPGNKNFRKSFRKNFCFRENFRKNDNFAKTKISQKQKLSEQIFTFREKEKRGFCFNPS